MSHSLSSILALSFLFSSTSFAQDSTKPINFGADPIKLLTALDKKARSFEKKFEKKRDFYLLKFERKEKKLFKKLCKEDSIIAKKAFGNIDSIYAYFRNPKLFNPKNNSVYLGHLDTLSTAINFLNDGKFINGYLLDENLESYKALQKVLNESEVIKQNLLARQKKLGQFLDKLGLTKKLRGFQKDVYYYSAQIKEIKSAFQDPSKLEQKLIDFLIQTDAFKEYLKKNSELGRFLSIPNINSGANTNPIFGLQTRVSLNQSLTTRFGPSVNSAQITQLSSNTNQGQLTKLKNKLLQFQTGNYGSSENSIKNFKPNSQKTKPFFQRFEYGFNIQTQKSRYYFPVTTDFGLSIGYKLNDNNLIGFGASYKLGLGSGWEHFKLSHQGLGLRSYVDYKLKKSLYLTGGYELNYLSVFKSIEQLKNYNSWQNSGLVGISIQYKLHKKVGGDFRLLWDFLSYSQMPQTQALLFRIGYKIK